MQKIINAVQDLNGNAVTGASVTVYTNAGHTTKATIYSDNSLTVAANPLTSDANGVFSFYAANGRYYLQASKVGVLTQNFDDVLVFDPNDSSSTNTGAAYVSFVQSGIAATAGTVQNELRYWFRPEQFGAAADGVTNDRAAITAADTAAGSGRLLFQAGKTYLCSTSLTITAPCMFQPGASISVPVGQTITFSGRVITLGGNPTSGSGTASFGADGNVFITSASGSGGFGFGTVLPSGADDFFHIERSVNTSTGISMKNQNTGALADCYLHMWGGAQDVSGSDVRIAAQSSALGGNVNIVAKHNSGAGWLNIIEADNKPVSIYTNNTEMCRFLAAANVANIHTFKGGATGSSVIRSALGDANISIIDDVPGSGSYFVRTGSANAFQFEVAHTASATRRVKVTGSNGGNPTIDASAGLLTIGGTSVTINIASGGSTSISTGVGSVKMASANPATNAAWIPLAYAGTTYQVPGWTTNSP